MSSRPGPWAPKSRPRSVSRRNPAGGRPSAGWLTSPGSWRGTRAPTWSCEPGRLAEDAVRARSRGVAGRPRPARQRLQPAQAISVQYRRRSRRRALPEDVRRRCRDRSRGEVGKPHHQMKHPAPVDERDRLQPSVVQRMRNSYHTNRARQHFAEMLQSVAYLATPARTAPAPSAIAAFIAQPRAAQHPSPDRRGTPGRPGRVPGTSAGRRSAPPW